MKTTTIISGNFATTGDKNFTARTATGTFFIHRNMLKQIGITKDADIKFPIYANVDTKMINPKLADGTFSPTPVARESAVAVFTTIELAVEANTADFKLQAMITSQKQSFGQDQKLDQEVINALLVSSIV